MVDVNYTFFLSLIIIVIGFIIKRLKIVSIDDGKVIARIVFNVTLPAVILSVIPYINVDLTLGLIPLIALIYGLVVLGFAYIYLRKSPQKLKGLMLMSVIGFNVGHFAYPLIQGIWGNTGLQYIAMFDIGNAIIVFGVSYIIGLTFSKVRDSSEEKNVLKNILKQLLKSVPLMTYVVAIVINLANIQIPIFIGDVVAVLSNANRALTLLLLGIFLDFHFEKSQWKNVTKVLLIRYAFGLTIGLTLFYLLPFNLLYREILAIALILPIGLAVIPFTVEFKFDEKMSGMMTNLSIIISFSLIWVLIIILGS
ncbi:MAG: AEC family transporter [Candidatus Lokiarchaeota archaeon]